MKTDDYVACWVPIIYSFFPETKGLELEDVDRLFAKEGSDTARMIDASVRRQGSPEYLDSKSNNHVEGSDV